MIRDGTCVRSDLEEEILPRSPRRCVVSGNGVLWQDPHDTFQEGFSGKQRPHIQCLKDQDPSIPQPTFQIGVLSFRRHWMMPRIGPIVQVPSGWEAQFSLRCHCPWKCFSRSFTRTGCTDGSGRRGLPRLFQKKKKPQPSDTDILATASILSTGPL